MVRDKEYYSSPSHDGRTSHENPKPSDEVSTETNGHRAIRLMKKNMEESKFCYIPPRIKLRRLDYLQHVRKRDEDAINYVAHVDYYILLRACAMVVEVYMRIMHVGVLDMERRSDWLEKKNRSLFKSNSS
ncbi:hypothetical protein V6N13_060047 [Hibiscus sabdariffa]|uniref:Uncharacterized protein n=1 Tax=Hibiscus sabdariffa TaxID=183260 RepID=A0ABR2GB52_9ROSI